VLFFHPFYFPFILPEVVASLFSGWTALALSYVSVIPFFAPEDALRRVVVFLSRLLQLSPGVYLSLIRLARLIEIFFPLCPDSLLPLFFN